MYGLLLLATHPEMVPEGLDVEQVWRESARVFAQNFCLIYEDEDVTPYLHQFVYHVGFFLKTCGSLEPLANFALEGKHRQNKRTVHSASSGHSRMNIFKNITYQQLARTTRMELANFPKVKRTERNIVDWKSRGLQKNQYLKKILTDYEELATSNKN